MLGVSWAFRSPIIISMCDSGIVSVDDFRSR